MLEHRLELPDRQRDFPRHGLSTEAEFPRIHIDAVGHRGDAVVPHEQAIRRGNAIVEQVSRRLGVDWAIIQHDEPVFAGDPEGFVRLRERRRNEAFRHQVCERNRRADRRRHRHQAARGQEAPPRDRVAASPPEFFVRGDRIGMVEVMDTTSLVFHFTFSQMAVMPRRELQV